MTLLTVIALVIPNASSSPPSLLWPCADVPPPLRPTPRPVAPAVTGGRNGYGAKLANIFSTEFTVEAADGGRGKLYKQVCVCVCVRARGRASDGLPRRCRVCIRRCARGR